MPTVRSSARRRERGRLPRSRSTSSLADSERRRKRDFANSCAAPFYPQAPRAPDRGRRLPIPAAAPRRSWSSRNRLPHQGHIVQSFNDPANAIPRLPGRRRAQADLVILRRTIRDRESACRRDARGAGTPWGTLADLASDFSSRRLRRLLASAPG